jgi:hypothetical protein
MEVYCFFCFFSQFVFFQTLFSILRFGVLKDFTERLDVQNFQSLEPLYPKEYNFWKFTVFLIGWTFAFVL